MTPAATPARGKPAAFGQEILQRRLRLTLARTSLKGALVLDFGCGNGAQTLAFHAVPARIVAVDIDREDLVLLSETLHRDGIRNILPVLYGGRRLPVRSGSISRVLSFEVLEHVAEEAAALQELHRVMAPGAEGVLTVPNKWWIFETHGTSLPLLPWHRVPFLSWLPGRVHRRFARARIYTCGSLRRLLQKHGFTILEMCYVTAPMDAVRAPWLQHILRRTVFASDRTRIPVLATAILVHFRKP
jgi:SAM-dependent methyltransferase